ncbi:MAG: hypothetical protein RID53_23250 [Coleofasciculus sp. B1-GNL1-01]|uniref:hypothetical protein n=1 Tax=Coleofasciculus sp. B1-GNL1-01 TaxID=3068484 RepID=UPI0032FC47E8
MNTSMLLGENGDNSFSRRHIRRFTCFPQVLQGLGINFRISLQTSVKGWIFETVAADTTGSKIDGRT